MTPIEILRAAKALIEDPARWARHYMARNDRGRPVAACDELAVRWCARGAIVRVSGISRAPALRAESILDSAAMGRAGRRASSINDHGTHADVMALFDRAIALAEYDEGAAR